MAEYQFHKGNLPKTRRQAKQALKERDWSCTWYLRLIPPKAGAVGMLSMTRKKREYLVEDNKTYFTPGSMRAKGFSLVEAVCNAIEEDDA